MWVRTQNKLGILKTKYFVIDDTNIKSSFDDYNSILLGRYSTKEKALKVLDMIEQHLDAQSKIVEKSMSEYIISDMNSIIFQMPQENEVQ